MNEIEPKILQCVTALKSGQCIAYPTEAVWGLGCDPFNEDAVNTILALKSRPVEKGLILIASQIQHVHFLLEDLPEKLLTKMKQAWPGHVTWLIPHRGRVPSFVSGNSAKVAVRVSAHPIVKVIGDAYQAPFISTSANPAGQPSATTLEQVHGYFPNESDLVHAPGEVGEQSRASTIIDAETGAVIRP